MYWTCFIKIIFTSTRPKKHKTASINTANAVPALWTSCWENPDDVRCTGSAKRKPSRNNKNVVGIVHQTLFQGSTASILENDLEVRIIFSINSRILVVEEVYFVRSESK